MNVFWYFWIYLGKQHHYRQDRSSSNVSLSSLTTPLYRQSLRGTLNWPRFWILLVGLCTPWRTRYGPSHDVSWNRANKCCSDFAAFRQKKSLRVLNALRIQKSTWPKSIFGIRKKDKYRVKVLFVDFSAHFDPKWKSKANLKGINLASHQVFIIQTTITGKSTLLNKCFCGFVLQRKNYTTNTGVWKI